MHCYSELELSFLDYKLDFMCDTCHVPVRACNLRVTNCSCVCLARVDSSAYWNYVFVGLHFGAMMCMHVSM